MALKKRYYSVDGVILGEEAVGGARTDYAVDALGSVTGTLLGRALQNAYAYKPFGDQLQRTGSGIDPAFRWVGSDGYRSSTTSYAEAHVRARTYSYGLARWTTVDPTWPSERPFSYANQRPLTFTDPTGLAQDNAKYDFGVEVNYGKYCGPYQNPYYDFPINSVPRPFDPLDKLCKHHDLSYFMAGCKGWGIFFAPFKDKTCTDADAVLCRESKKVNCDTLYSKDPTTRKHCNDMKSSIGRFICHPKAIPVVGSNKR